MSTVTQKIHPLVDSTDIFKNDIFKGKVLFCTGGGSGICKGMTESIVSLSTLLALYIIISHFHSQMRHGADAVIIGRK